MKTRIIRLIVLVVIVPFVFYSCGKDIDFPKRYVLDSFHVGVLKAYTNSGEITDELKIREFIMGQDDLFWQIGYQSVDLQIIIEIISETKAKISSTDTLIYYDIIRENGIMYFQFSDTLVSYGSLKNDRLMYSPLYIQSNPGITGIPSLYIPCYYIIESKGELHIPMVSYIEKVYGATGDLMSSQGIGNFNNVFNTIYLNMIQNSGSSLIDTIVYQNNKVIFREK
jgi:hypothetical protein